MPKSQVDSHLPIDHLQPNPLQPRGSINKSSIQELSDSIKEHGVLEPLVVAKTPAGLQIIAGERRWRAAKLAGLTKVPVHLIETSPQGMLEMAIIENVQREDLNPIERAKAFERLMRDFTLKTNDIAKRIGKSPAYVSNSLRLLQLPDALKDGLLSGDISEGHARALAAIPDTRAMIEAYKMVLRESASVRRAEELARKFKRSLQQNNTPIKDSTKLILSDHIDAMQQNIKKALGPKSNVSLKQSLRQTKLLIVLKGSPQDNQDRLDKIYSSLTSRKN